MSFTCINCDNEYEYEKEKYVDIDQNQGTYSCHHCFLLYCRKVFECPFWTYLGKSRSSNCAMCQINMRTINPVVNRMVHTIIKKWNDGGDRIEISICVRCFKENVY